MMRTSKPTPGKTSRPPADAKRYDINEEFKDLTVMPKANTTHPGMRTDGGPQTARARTKNYPIGEMRRTNLEGMIPAGEKTEYVGGKPSKYRPKASNTTRPPSELPSQDINEVFDGLTAVKPKTTRPGLRTGGSQTARVKTKNYPIGKMDRTNIEGMLPPGVKTEYQTKTGAPSEYGRGMTHQMSFAPAKALTVLTKPGDAEMAAKQTDFSKMSQGEQVAQNKWVNTVLKRFAPCPQGWDFKRVEGGYQCHGKYHFQCDELIAEAKGGMWMVPYHAKGDFQTRWGPYYAEDTNPKHFFYSGPDPIPEGAPVVLDKGEEYYDDYRARLLQGRAQSQRSSQRSRSGNSQFGGQAQTR